MSCPKELRLLEVLRAQYIGDASRDEVIESFLNALSAVAPRVSGLEDSGDDLDEALRPLLASSESMLSAYRAVLDRERRQEEAKRDSEGWTRLIAEVSSDGSYIVDVTGNGGAFTWVDQGLERITGYPMRELLGMDWSAVVHEDDRKKLLLEANEAPIGETHRAEFRIVRKDGEARWVHRAERRHRLPGAEGLRIVGALHDVTERIELELQRRRVEEELRHMQKIDAIGTLAGGVAHDFNNVLYVILGNAELALSKVGDDHAAHKNLKEILSAARRGADVTDRILQYSRVGIVPQGMCDVGQVMAETREFLAATLPSSTQLVFDGAVDDVFVPVGASDLQQVIVNLCTNSSHAMQEGGEVHVRVDRLGEDGAEVDLAVSDSGHGMSESLIQHVFEPYFTTKPRGKGTGLGLSVVQGIVKAAGGSIAIESEVGAGTTVHVRMPSAEAPAETSMDDVSSGVGSESVLFVDDEPRVARLGQEILESLGYSVEALTSSRAALDRFRADPSRFDIVVTDQTMPHLTGDAFAREVLAVRPEMPIILCTGFSERLDGVGWNDAGIHSFLKKPFGLEQLGSTVRRALDESRGAQWPKSSS